MPALRKTGALALTGAVLLTAAGCSRPDWTDPETSKGSRTLPAQPPARVIPMAKRPPPAVPGWVAPLLGKPVREAFRRDGVCIGNTDGVAKRYPGEPPRVLVVGWGWETGAKAPVRRVVLTDGTGAIIGGADSGAPRPDVRSAVPAVTSGHTGWEVLTPVRAGRVTAHGVVERGRAICSLASVDF